jgi:hypothetical protein
MTPWTQYQGFAWKLEENGVDVRIVDEDGDDLAILGPLTIGTARAVAEHWIDGYRTGYKHGRRLGRIELQIEIRNILDPERSL